MTKLEGKHCTGCREYLSTSSFRSEKNGALGLRSRCILCQAAYGAQYYQRHKERLERQRKVRRSREGQ